MPFRSKDGMAGSVGIKRHFFQMPPLFSRLCLTITLPYFLLSLIFYSHLIKLLLPAAVVSPGAGSRFFQAWAASLGRRLQFDTPEPRHLHFCRSLIPKIFFSRTDYGYLANSVDKGPGKYEKISSFNLVTVDCLSDPLSRPGHIYWTYR